MSNVAFSWNGDFVARVAPLEGQREGGELRLYTVPDLRQVWEARIPSSALALAWVPKEHGLLITAHLDELCIWESVTGDLVRRVELEGRLGSLSLSGDGQWLGTYSDLCAFLVGLPAMERVLSWPRPGLIRGVFPDLTGARTVIATDVGAWLWTPASDLSPRKFWDEPSWSACWSADGSALILGTSDALLVLDGASLEVRKTLARGEAFKAVALTPSEQLVLACGKQVRAWEMDSARVYATYRYAFPDLAVTPNGEYAATSIGMFSMASGRGRTFWGQVDEMPTFRPAEVHAPATVTPEWVWSLLVALLAVLALLAWQMWPRPIPIKPLNPKRHAVVRKPS